MLNHETTSIAREKEDERKEFEHINIDRVEYYRSNKTLHYPCHLYLTGGSSYAFKVTRQKETYLEGGWVATGVNLDARLTAYTLRTLKAKIVDFIEFDVQ